MSKVYSIGFRFVSQSLVTHAVFVDVAGLRHVRHDGGLREGRLRPGRHAAGNRPVPGHSFRPAAVFLGALHAAHDPPVQLAPARLAQSQRHHVHVAGLFRAGPPDFAHGHQPELHGAAVHRGLDAVLRRRPARSGARAGRAGGLSGGAGRAAPQHPARPVDRGPGGAGGGRAGGHRTGGLRRRRSPHYLSISFTPGRRTVEPPPRSTP